MSISSKQIPPLIENCLCQSASTLSKDDFPALITTFKYLTNNGSGDKLFQLVRDDFENPGKNFKLINFLEEIELLSLREQISFLYQIIIMEILALWRQIEFRQIDDKKFITSKEFNKALESTLEDKKQNLVILEKLSSKWVCREDFWAFLKVQERSLIHLSNSIFFLKNTNRLHPLIKEGNPSSENFRDFLQKMEKMFKDRETSKGKEKIHKYNQFNADVEYLLKKSSLKFETEYQLNNSRFCDFVLHDKRIVIELDGAYHFFDNDPLNSLPSNIFRNLLILLNDWKLIELNLITWDKFRTNNTMEEYFFSLLQMIDEDPSIKFISA
jgi:hypothetical protein